MYTIHLTVNIFSFKYSDLRVLQPSKTGHGWNFMVIQDCGMGLLLGNSLEAIQPFICLLRFVNLGYLPFTWKNRKFQLENQIVGVISFGKLQKIWAVI